MFFFGSAQDTADLYLSEAYNIQGPPVALHSLRPEDLANSLVYARLAYEKAKKDDAPEEVLEILVNHHDHYFRFLLDADPNFRAKVLSPKQFITWLGGFDKDNIQKYKRFALSAS